MICGHCKTSGVTVSHVRLCSQPKPRIVNPNAAWPDTDVSAIKIPAAVQLTIPIPDIPTPVPPSKYALMATGGLSPHTYFYVVKAGTRNPNIRFVDRLVGSIGNWRKVRMPVHLQKSILHSIAADSYVDGGRVLHGPEAAAVRYSREFTACACCDSPLSDPVSVAQGIGPVCIKRFAA